MATRNQNTDSQASKDLNSMRHSVYEATKAAGRTHFGRATKVGGVMGAKRSKGARDKRACRGRHNGDE